MKNRKRTLALLLCLALTVSLCACGGVTADPTGGTASPDPSQNYGAVSSPDPSAASTIEADLTQDAVAFSTGLSPADVLLTVSGTDIPADLFLYWLFQSCYYFEYSYYYYGVTVAGFAEMLLEDTVNSAVYYTVLRQRAVELGCLPTDAQVKGAMDELLDEGPEYYENLKAAYGLSDESIDYLTTLSLYYDNLLDALVPTATEEMLNSYVYHVKHILLKTVDDQNQPLGDDEIADRKAQAEDILARLQAVEGEERLALFDELMKEYSQDGRDENGDLYAPDGYTAVPGNMVAEFEEASFALPIGGLSGIVESSYGYHIILRGEVPKDEIGNYTDACRAYQLDSGMKPLLDEAEVVRADALDALDVAGFYQRYTAYQTAVMEQYHAGLEGGGDAAG